MNLRDRIRRFLGWAQRTELCVRTKRGEPAVLVTPLLSPTDLIRAFSAYCLASEVSWYWWGDETGLVYYLHDYGSLPDKEEWQSWPTTTRGLFLKIDSTTRAEFEEQCDWYHDVLGYKGLHILVCAIDNSDESSLPGPQTIQEMVDFRDGRSGRVRAIIARWFDGDDAEYWLPGADPRITSDIMKICEISDLEELVRMKLYAGCEGVQTFERWLDFPHNSLVEAKLVEFRSGGSQ